MVSTRPVWDQPSSLPPWLAWCCGAPIRGSVLALGLALGPALLGPTALAQNTNDAAGSFREVVLTGADVPRLLGTAPDRVAAFAYDGGWTPIPVQVDERERLDLGVAFDGRNAERCDTSSGGFCFEEDGSGVTVLEYTGTDATGLETLIGPDSDPTFDADDEVVFMQRFAGQAAPENAAPDGADSTTRTSIQLSGGRYVYLFAVPTGSVPRSPRRLVSLDAVLLNGAFPEDYDFSGMTASGAGSGNTLGSNPEATTIETAHYRLGFSDRWIHDDLRLKQGGQTGPDLLDRAKVLLELGSCNRTEWTASVSRGTIVALRDGPVRAIRVVRGFNSGPLSTGTYHFYERHAVFTTDLRVHPIPGILDFYDYSEAALGMRYADILQPTQPLQLDGQNDGLDPVQLPDASLFWSAVSGSPGALVHTYRLQVDCANGPPDNRFCDLAPFYRYWDEGTTTRQCTGDNRAIGGSGVLIDTRIPATDPRRDVFISLRATRVVYYSGMPLSAAEAEAIAAQSLPAVPLEVTEGSLGEEETRLGGAVIEALFPTVVTEGTVRAEVALFEAAPYDVAVFDVLGRRVFEQPFTASEPRRVTIPMLLQGLPSGAYWFRVRSEATGLSVSRRLTVVR